MGDVGDGGTDTVTKKASAGYHVSKWIILNKMKREIERKKRENDDLRARGIALTDKTEEEAGVEAYWATARPEYFKLTEEQIRALAIMQIYFKTMIQIARSRKTQKAGMGQTHKIVLCQSAVRRFFARREAMALMLAKRSEEKHYTKFCKTMTGKGYTVYMFSKKYGTVSKRTLRFDDDCKNVCYKTADGLLGSTREIDIKEIYQVNKGMSGFGYPKARPKRMGFTFHLAILGDKVCDFEAMSGQELKEMLSGFQKLRLLACSRSCFYIDKSGVPSRAVGSNVKYAIEDTGHKTGRRPKTVSEADLMRFRHACKLLQAEYDRWRRRLDEEKEKFDDEERQAKIAAEELAEYNATHEDEAEVGDEEEDEAGGGGGGGEGEEEGLGGGEEEGEGEGGELSDAEPEAEDEGLGQDEGEERRQQKQRRRKPPPDQAEVDNIRKVVEGMYEQVNPSRLKELPNMFGDWRGLERELLVEVRKTYNEKLALMAAEAPPEGVAQPPPPPKKAGGLFSKVFSRSGGKKKEFPMIIPPPSPDLRNGGEADDVEEEEEVVEEEEVEEEEEEEVVEEEEEEESEEEGGEEEEEGEEVMEESEAEESEAEESEAEESEAEESAGNPPPVKGGALLPQPAQEDEEEKEEEDDDSPPGVADALWGLASAFVGGDAEDEDEDEDDEEEEDK